MSFRGVLQSMEQGLNNCFIPKQSLGMKLPQKLCFNQTRNEVSLSKYVPKLEFGNT